MWLVWSVSVDYLYLLLLLGVGHGRLLVGRRVGDFCSVCTYGTLPPWFMDRHNQKRGKLEQGEVLTLRHYTTPQPTIDAINFSSKPNGVRGGETNNKNMHLMYYLDENGKRVYTLKVRRCCFTL